MLIDEVNDQLVLIDWSHELLPTAAPEDKPFVYRGIDYRGLITAFLECEKHTIPLDKYVLALYPDLEWFYPAPEYRQQFYEVEDETIEDMT